MSRQRREGDYNLRSVRDPSYWDLETRIQVNQDIHFVPSTAETTPCRQRFIGFGQGTVNGIPCSYLEAKTKKGLEVLMDWNTACHVKVSAYSLKSYGFAEKTLSNNQRVKVLVIGVVKERLSHFFLNLKKDEENIEGLDFVRVLNQFSIALYEGNSQKLFCKARDLFVGSEGNVIVPFTKHLEGPDFFNGNSLNGIASAYMDEMKQMEVIFNNGNAYGKPLKENATLKMLMHYLLSKPEFVKFFQTDLIPLAYDTESFLAFLCSNVNEVKIKWEDNHANQIQDWSLDYGAYMSKDYRNNEWESDILSGRYGSEWVKVLDDYNGRRHCKNVPPVFSPLDPPKSRRNCPMIFIVFVRHRLTHSVKKEYALKKLSKSKLVRELDLMMPGAICQYMIQMIITGKSSSVLVTQQR